jgi:hypothetical protein
MLDNIVVTVYFVTGFIITYLAFETALHFTAWKIRDKTIKAVKLPANCFSRKPIDNEELLKRLNEIIVDDTYMDSKQVT